MATPAQGRPAERSYADPTYGDWDMPTLTRDALRTIKETNAGRTYTTTSMVKGADPVYRYGVPSTGMGAKGAILALDPDDHTRGDALYFSRYPTELTEKIEAVLAADTTPGRAYPAFQQLGARGVQLSAELWFCDAFLWTHGTAGPREAAARASIASRGGNSHAIQSLNAGPLSTLAEQARTFFEFYMAGHDGTGIALPPVDMFLQWGGRELPIPIVIKSVDIKQECFTSPPEGARVGYKPGGTPQIVTAKVEFEVNIPLRTFNPYQPKRPKPLKPSAPKVKTCPNGGGALADGSIIIGSVVIPGNLVKLGKQIMDADIVRQLTGPKGFAPP